MFSGNSQPIFASLEQFLMTALCDKDLQHPQILTVCSEKEMSENDYKEKKDKLTQLPVVRKLLIASLGPVLVHQGPPSSSDTYQENQKEPLLDEQVSACKHRRGNRD
jgi:hypothetical protein